MGDIERDDVAEIAAQLECLVCNSPYGLSGVDVVGQYEDAWLITVSCPQCEAEGLIIATVEEDTDTDLEHLEDPETIPARIMSDVTYDEWLSFNQLPLIASDDVLDTHVFLKDFDGDFQSLFGADITVEED